MHLMLGRKWSFYFKIHAFDSSGHELRSWLLYYSIPVLSGILPQPYLNHLPLLVADKIAAADLQLAEQLMAKFYRQYQELYG